MTLQEQVCTLEQAKRLKELGCEQHSFFVWKCVYGDWRIDPSYVIDPVMFANDSRYAKHRAYTVAELGEMLVEQGNNAMPFVAGGLWWRQTKYYQTEAQARAALLIHKLEKEKQHDT